MKIVKCGVLQHSVLGPLLFPIFVNYLNNPTKVLDPLLFADDTKLLCSDDNIKTIFKTANQEPSQINGWLLANKLFLNEAFTSPLYTLASTIQISHKLALIKLKLKKLFGK